MKKNLAPKFFRLIAIILSLVFMFVIVTGCKSKQSSLANYDEAIKSFPKMKILVNDADLAKKQGQAISDYFKQNLGIQTEIEPLTFKDKLDRMHKADYQISFARWGPDYNDPMTFLDMWLTGGGLNDAFYSNPNFDNLIKQASSEKDPAKRMDFMGEAEKILLEDAPTSPIFFSYKNYIINPKVKGEVLRAVGIGTDLYHVTKDGSKEFSFALDEEPPQLNSTLSEDAVSMVVLGHVVDGLTRIGKDGKPAPGIAEKWDINSDYTEYTFHLRDTKWSNGSPVTANDFAYAWLKTLSPDSNVGGPYAYILYPIKNAEEYNTGKITDPKEVGIQVIDSKTLKVTLKQPVPYFLNLTSFVTYFPVNQTYYESHKDSYGKEAANMLYNGPYTIEKWAHNQEIILKKNPNYWNAGYINLDSIKIKISNDSNALINDFFAGNIDMVNIPGEKLDEVKAKGIVPKRYADGFVYYLMFNGKDSVLKDSKIRKALSLAINRQDFAQTVMKDGSLPAYGLVSDIIPGKSGTFRNDYGDILRENQLEEAKKLMLDGMKAVGLVK